MLFWIFTGQAVAGTKMGDRAYFPGERGVGYGGATVVKEDVASPRCHSRPFPPFSAQMIVDTYLPTVVRTCASLFPPLRRPRTGDVTIDQIYLTFSCRTLDVANPSAL